MAAPLAAAGAARAGALAWSERRWLLWVLVFVLGLPLALVGLITAMVGGLAGQASAPPVGSYAPSQTALADIPPPYLRMYEATGATYSVGWEYLAAIGKVETNHCRSRLPGVHSATNSAGAAGCMQFLLSTWALPGIGNGGDVYDPKDAIPAAARYLRANGAPADWDSAIFAYNHAAWYVDEVQAWAERYRGAAITDTGAPVGSANSQRLPDGSRWLAPVPSTSVTCDSRIVPDVELLVRRYRLAVSACFDLNGHKAAGEHPLGLATDLVPGAGGNWALLNRLAHDLGWRDSCAATGCAGQLPSPMRFIGWNGYPSHGDPAHAGADAHLHLSWAHTPAAAGSPAERVQTLLPPPRGDKTP